MIKFCPVCSGKSFKDIFLLNKINKYNLNYFDRLKEAVNAPTAKVHFVECKKCEFLFNKSYTQLDYKIDYNANRSYSKIFDNYLNEVVNYLVKFIINKDKIENVLEIGFGDAEFIKKLAKIKNNKFKKILGYDPSSNISNSKPVIGVELIKDYYTAKVSFRPDLLILRHTLEHISNVTSFLKKILHKKPKFVFIEVPCKSFVYKDNIHYFSNEHCSYFDDYSIQILLKKFGYKKVNIKKVFNGENILSIFIKTKKEIKIKNKISRNPSRFNLEKFQKKFHKKIDLSNDFFWGAAGKGVLFFNLLGINYKKCRFVLDINKEIQGKFLGLSGIKIISPNDLTKYINEKSKIFIMNVLYKKEIEKILKKMKIKNKVYNLLK